MKRLKVNKVLAAVSSIALIIALIFVGIITVLTNRGFYYNRFKEDKTAASLGIQQSELDRILDDYIAFIGGNKENLKETYTIGDKQEPFYTNSERLYLIEQRDAIRTFKTAAVVFGALFAVTLTLLIMIKKREALTMFGKAFFWTLGAAVLMLAAIGIIASTDLNAFRISINDLIYSSAQFTSDMAIAKMFPLFFFGWELKRIYIMTFIYLLAALAIVYFMYKLSRPRKDEEDDYLYQ